MRLVAYGHVTGGGAQAPRLGVLLRESGVKWGDQAAVTMVSARRLRGRLPRGRGARGGTSNGGRGAESAGKGHGAVRPDGCPVPARPEHLRPAELPWPCRSLCPPSSTGCGDRGWAPAARPAGAPQPRLPR